jgi:SSS family transporter
MLKFDYIVILIYFIGLLITGGVLSTKIKNSKDMFIAGRNSSWWIAGLSTYMTIFSAGSFVVWGGVAFRSGMVAVTIGNALGIAAIFTGLFISGKWRKLNIDSPAEYLGIRFGKATISFYTIVGLIGRSVSTAVALYAVSIMMVALIPLPEGHFLSNPQTGNLSVSYAILILGVITVIYTIAGGFLAVLMTDVIQFVVLLVMILFLIPLAFSSVGGVNSFVESAPEGFFSLVSGEYSFIWLILWCILNFFMISGDWPFVQRYISVPSVKDAKKTAYLVGALYLITPLFWYLPALIYRVVDPGADPEQAYILMSKHVLPVGMLGIMMAAMLSATMSMIDSTLNVFAGVFTYDIYRSFKSHATEKKLMSVGRIFTLFFGLCIITLALLIPLFGGAEKVIVTFLTLVIMPLFIPSVWGLFSKYINQKAVWISMGITYSIGFLIKIGFSNGGILTKTWEGGKAIALVVQENVQFLDAFIGLIVPVSILLIIEVFSRRKGFSAGWERLVQFMEANSGTQEDVFSPAFARFAIKILLWTFAILGLTIGLMSIFSQEQKKVMIIFSIILLSISALIVLLYLLSKITKNKFKKSNKT